MTASTQFNYGRRNSNVTPYTIPTSSSSATATATATTTSKTHHHHEQQSPIGSNYQLHHHHHSYTSNNSRHNHHNNNHHNHSHSHSHQHQHSHSHINTNNQVTSPVQVISSPPLSASVPTLSREFVVRRISEGETGRLKEELRCEACGKGYKHISSLAKHLWEHTPEWNVTKKLLISKHQQVQLLEAASILIGMNENTNIGGTTIQSQHQQAVQRHIIQHSKIKSSTDQGINGNSPYSPPNSNNSTSEPIINSDPVSMSSLGERNEEETSSIQFKNGYNTRYDEQQHEEDNDDDDDDDDDDDTEEYESQNRLNYGRSQSISHEPPIYEKHEVTSPILESEQDKKSSSSSTTTRTTTLRSPSSSSYFGVVKSEIPVKTNFSIINETKNKEVYGEETVIGTMEA